MDPCVSNCVSMQEGKTLAMMALEGGTHKNGYICLLLVAAAGLDLEGVDLRHKSDVSIPFLLFRHCSTYFFISDSERQIWRLRYFLNNCLIVIFSFKYFCLLLSSLSGRYNACNACN